MSNARRKRTILFDKIFGETVFFLAKPFLSTKKETVANDFKKILIIKTGGIGDYLLSIPVFKRIRSTYPNADITLFIFKRNKICLEFYNNFNKVVVIDEPKNLFAFLSRFERFDLCIDFDQYRKIPSILSIFSYAPMRIGFDSAGKGKAYTDKITYRDDEYEAQSFMNLLKPLGITQSITTDDLLFKARNEVIPQSVAIYACAMKEENRLPLSMWADMIKTKGQAFTYYFIGGKADKKRYDELQAMLPEYTIVRADGTTSLLGSIDLLSSCESMLSEDGGTYHMGVVAGTKITGYWLHGEKNMRKWASPEADNKLIG